MNKKLVAGGPNDPMLPLIRHAILHADEVELAVAFTKSSGLQLLLPALEEALVERGAKLTILTSDYLSVTDPQALRSLMLLKDLGAAVRVFQVAPSQSFHLKAYIFVRRVSMFDSAGIAFVGSSNISRPALMEGLEWNYRVVADGESNDGDNQGFREIRNEFATLLLRPEVADLTYEWIAQYEKRRVVPKLPVAPGSHDAELPKPVPNDLQVEVLAALEASRESGERAGLVVLATGLGKTYLAAFDTEQAQAGRVLFVAHREEILLQAEKTFQSVHPKAVFGRFGAANKDTGADMVFASVQTLGKAVYLEQFDPSHFDYIIVDEFHHAAAPTYRRLLRHFDPKFLLGLTATPERTDQSDILNLCGGNLVFEKNLFYGVEQGYLCPFTYFGIYDESVDYQTIPWRNGRFDPESLSHKLATLGRFRHVLREWQEKSVSRTLAFCVSKKHAQFMADRFNAEGIRAAAVYGGSEMARDESLELIKNGELDVIFSVDLFSEGVDVPAIDTVMMLRPTESKVLFLQQLGRGLRTNVGKDRLIVLDFIGNHQGFLNKPQALFGLQGSHRSIREFTQQYREGNLSLPSGCFVNYDLEIIEFLEALTVGGPSKEYQSLKSSLGRRPTLTEFYHSGASLMRMRKSAGSWWEFVDGESDAGDAEAACLERHKRFLAEVEITNMTKSFKAILLESLNDIEGFVSSPTVRDLADAALRVFRRRRGFIADIHADYRNVDEIDPQKWEKYWAKNPIKAWTGGNVSNTKRPWFEIEEGLFKPTFTLLAEELAVFSEMLQEIVEYRLASYESRENAVDTVAPSSNIEVPFFSNLAIACGHFKAGNSEGAEFRRLGSKYDHLQNGRYFIARAAGDSMDGGEAPVRDGDYLLLEHVPKATMSDVRGATVVVERPGDSGAAEYVLRVATAGDRGETVLRAQNPRFAEFEADESTVPIARLDAVLDPLELLVGQEMMREEIPALFGATFNPGSWNSGHVAIKGQRTHVLLVTINKQGQAKEHRYVDRFDEDGRTFHWQSQNQTRPESKRGLELINHRELGISIHLFVRQKKLLKGKAAPFVYRGKLDYVGHEGSAPVSVTWKLDS